ncbi:hypothetical protein [Litorimonas sp. WD9-15]|uniref:hypothetical protein n=1 Tax=Litorimonas sp. WD9-15 TaxID=3418716 RepID=UPI003CFF6769
MSPTLEDGDYILTLKPRRLRPGFIYVLKHERLGRIVKRLSVLENDSCQWSGDNSASTSSDRIGATPTSCISGRAIWRISPSGIKRL